LVVGLRYATRTSPSGGERGSGVNGRIWGRGISRFAGKGTEAKVGDTPIPAERGSLDAARGEALL